jgi:hypothetical protein
MAQEPTNLASLPYLNPYPETVEIPSNLLYADEVLACRHRRWLQTSQSELKNKRSQHMNRGELVAILSNNRVDKSSIPSI